MKSVIVKNQEYFFNKHSHLQQKDLSGKFFFDYKNKEQVDGFKWISNSYTVLEYGCNTGTSLDMLAKYFNLKKYNIIGVDIAQEAINMAKKKYPHFTFYKIKNNKILQIKKHSVDAVFMYHVLHHSHDHLQIFQTVYSKLKKNGQFVIADLTSNNPLINFSRFIFTLLPDSIKSRFDSDLIVDGKIPEKYKINITKIQKQLKQANLHVKSINYGHLFLFVFGWLELIFKRKLSNRILINIFFHPLKCLEDFLLKYRFFQNISHLILIKCIKK